MKVYAYIYVQNADGEIVPATGKITSRWASLPIDWTDGSAEHLDITTPPFARSSPERFFGYVFGVYYQGRLQEARFDPLSLARDFLMPNTAP